MSIVPTDLNAFGCAQMPLSDTDTVGGLIEPNARIIFTEMTLDSALYLTSSVAGDTRTVTIRGRINTGLMVSESVVLNGQNTVATLNIFNRFEMADAPYHSTAVVAIQDASLVQIGTLQADPASSGRVSLRRMFIEASSEGSPATRYEKFFWRNGHGTLAAFAAKVFLSADPASQYRIAIETTKGGSTAIANRRASPPAGLSAFISIIDLATGLPVPGGLLAPGEAIAVWVEQSLDPGELPTLTSFDVDLLVTST